LKGKIVSSVNLADDGCRVLSGCPARGRLTVIHVLFSARRLNYTAPIGRDIIRRVT